MSAFNKVILLGNLTRDPEPIITPSGIPITKIGLAVNRKYKNANTGQETEEVCFVDVTSFGNQANTITQHFHKGKAILVEGRLRLDQWEDSNTGQKRSKLSVVMERFEFIGSKSDSTGGAAAAEYDQYGNRYTQPQTAPQLRPAAQPAGRPTTGQRAHPNEPAYDDGDVPF